MKSNKTIERDNFKTKVAICKYPFIHYYCNCKQTDHIEIYRIFTIDFRTFLGAHKQLESQYFEFKHHIDHLKELSHSIDKDVTSTWSRLSLTDMNDSAKSGKVWFKIILTNSSIVISQTNRLL